MVGAKRSPVRPLGTDNVSLAFPGELLINPNNGNFIYVLETGGQIEHKKPGTLTVTQGDVTLLNAGDLSTALTLNIPVPSWDSIAPDHISASLINGLTANKVLVSDANGNLTASDIGSEVFSYLSGLTGNIQNQLNGKAAINHTHTEYIGASGGTITGTLTVSGTLSVTGNATGIQKVFTGTLSTNWAGSAAPYSQTVTVNGILATDRPICDYVNSGTYATDQTREEGWLNVYRGVTAANQITFYAHDKPTVEIPFVAQVTR